MATIKTRINFCGEPRTLEFVVNVDLPFYDHYQQQSSSFRYFLSMDFTSLPANSYKDDPVEVPILWEEREEETPFDITYFGWNEFADAVRWYKRISKDTWYVHNALGLLQLYAVNGLSNKPTRGLRFPGTVTLRHDQIAYVGFTKQMTIFPAPQIDITKDAWKLLQEDFHKVLKENCTSEFAGEKACRLCKKNGKETIVLDWVKKCPTCNNMTFDWAFSAEGHQVPYLANVIQKLAFEFGHEPATYEDVSDIPSPGSKNMKLKVRLPIGLRAFDGDASSKPKA